MRYLIAAMLTLILVLDAYPEWVLYPLSHPMTADDVQER